MGYLEAALPTLSGEIRGWTELQGNTRAESCVSSYPLTLPLMALHGGLEKLSRGLDAPSWWLALLPEGLALGIDASDAVFPADRRSLLEPWFDSKLIQGGPEQQKGRLEVAVALGWLEDGGAQISTTTVAEEGRSVSQVRAVWQPMAV